MYKSVLSHIVFILYYAKSDWHQGQQWGLFPEVAGILPKCRRHVDNIPATERNKPHYWLMMPVTICFVIPLIEMDTELEAIVNQAIKFKISTTQ